MRISEFMLSCWQSPVDEEETQCSSQVDRSLFVTLFKSFWMQHIALPNQVIAGHSCDRISLTQRAIGGHGIQHDEPFPFRGTPFTHQLLICAVAHPRRMVVAWTGFLVRACWNNTCNMLQSGHQSVGNSWRRCIFRQCARKVTKFTAVSRRLEIFSRVSTAAIKSFDKSWNQNLICYPAISIILAKVHFLKSYHGAPSLSSASVQWFLFFAFAKFASPGCASLPPGSVKPSSNLYPDIIFYGLSVSRLFRNGSGIRNRRFTCWN
jgi:hypothetical protein